jgi:hypothetical protein
VLEGPIAVNPCRPFRGSIARLQKEQTVLPPLTDHPFAVLAMLGHINLIGQFLAVLTTEVPAHGLIRFTNPVEWLVATTVVLRFLAALMMTTWAAILTWRRIRRWIRRRR